MTFQLGFEFGFLRADQKGAQTGSRKIRLSPRAFSDRKPDEPEHEDNLARSAFVQS